MIQRYLKDYLKDVIPELTWTMDYYTGEDTTGTVYYEGGSKPPSNDVNTRYPTYMVYIRSSNWGLASTAAQKVFDTLHKKSNFGVTGALSYHVFFIEAVSEPNRIGVKDGIMDYSINFDATLIREE